MTNKDLKTICDENIGQLEYVKKLMCMLANGMIHTNQIMKDALEMALEEPCGLGGDTDIKEEEFEATATP